MTELLLHNLESLGFKNERGVFTSHNDPKLIEQIVESAIQQNQSPGEKQVKNILTSIQQIIGGPQQYLLNANEINLSESNLKTLL